MRTGNYHRLTTEQFIERARKTHGDTYDYSQADYNRATKKVTIVCRIHGPFQQFPFDHTWSGKGCPVCKLDKISKKTRLGPEKFIEKSRAIHGDRYNYSKSDYQGARSKIVITCPRHGDFTQTADSHMRGVGCPACSNSRGEKAVAEFLDRLGINYEQEKKFPECVDKRPLQFDFSFTYRGVRFLVEYQGKHHYSPIKFFESKREEKHEWYKRHDEMKREFARCHKFVLIEIPYTEKDVQGFLNSEIQSRIAGR